MLCGTFHANLHAVATISANHRTCRCPRNLHGTRLRAEGRDHPEGPTDTSTTAADSLQEGLLQKGPLVGGSQQEGPPLGGSQQETSLSGASQQEGPPLLEEPLVGGSLRNHGADAVLPPPYPDMDAW